MKFFSLTIFLATMFFSLAVQANTCTNETICNCYADKLCNIELSPHQGRDIFVDHFAAGKLYQCDFPMVRCAATADSRQLTLTNVLAYDASVRLSNKHLYKAVISIDKRYGNHRFGELGFSAKLHNPNWQPCSVSLVCHLKD